MDEELGRAAGAGDTGLASRHDLPEASRHRFARSEKRRLQLIGAFRWMPSSKLEHRLHQCHQVGITCDVESLDLWQCIRDGEVAQIDRDEIDALGY